jgi:epoxyqueuosine reductase
METRTEAAGQDRAPAGSQGERQMETAAHPTAHPSSQLTAGELVALGSAAGCARVGVCDVAPFDSVRDSLEERRSAGLAAGLGFTFADPPTATDIRRSFPWANRLVVAGMPYLPGAGSPGSPEEPGDSVRVARFAVDDAYGPLRSALEVIVGRLESSGYRGVVLIDDARLVDRAAAVRAGLGWWGKNSMVLAPGQGPWMVFGSVVTDAILEVSQMMERGCGSCDACLPACPTGALIAPGVLDARRCLAAVLQSPGVIPIDLRVAVGDRLYGCDDCLDACPPGVRLLESSAVRRGRHLLGWLLSASDQDLAAEFGHFYLAKADVDMVRRNALVAAGNTGGAGLLPAVVGYLGHPNPVLRAHAVWTARRIGPAWIEDLLTALGQTESDGRVVDEINPVRLTPAEGTPDGSSPPPSGGSRRRPATI